MLGIRILFAPRQRGPDPRMFTPVCAERKERASVSAESVHIHHSFHVTNMYCKLTLRLSGRKLFAIASLSYSNSQKNVCANGTQIGKRRVTDE